MREVRLCKAKRRRIETASIFLFACFIFPQFLLSGSPNDPSSNLKSKTIIRTEVALVDIVVTAVDSNGRHIPGLQSDDFEVFDNRQPQTIEYFGEHGKGGKMPLTIVLLVDTSRSVRNKLEYEKKTAAEFFQQLLQSDKDQAMIIQFDSRVSLVQDFTKSSASLIEALDGLKVGNSTSLYDAVYLAAEGKLKYANGRKVMIILSDGDDNSSRVKREEAMEAAQKNNVLICGIGVQTPDSSFKALKKFAAETGGAFFSPHAEPEEIQAAFRSMREYIEGQYSLAYSLDAKKDGSFHTISINSKVRGVKVRAREGYYAPQNHDERSGNGSAEFLE
jgi:VWFA-related protein